MRPPARSTGPLLWAAALAVAVVAAERLFLLGLRGTATGVALLSFGAAAAAAVAAVAAAGTAKIAVRQVDPAAEWLVLMGTLLFGVVFPWLIGRYWRQSRELTAAGWARAEQLEREHRIVADRARPRERARTAQDMHDSLGHELSLIALRAGALQVAPDMAEAHRTAAAELRAAASDATERLHGIVGLLREDDEPAPLAPPGESIAALIEGAADSGLPVTLQDPPHHQPQHNNPHHQPQHNNPHHLPSDPRSTHECGETRTRPAPPSPSNTRGTKMERRWRSRTSAPGAARARRAAVRAS
ncbi:sensor histidine kinase [Streptomyces sp. NPDC056656]|uniref:sensor histidine kinase n=1 Tax=Streptomyces sp. NPDC056656 TaxID=3345895 RepID=UPI003694DB3A